MRDSQKGTCKLIDVAISGDRNITQKAVEKILKYKDLTREQERMWILTFRRLTSTTVDVPHR